MTCCARVALIVFLCATAAGGQHSGSVETEQGFTLRLYDVGRRMDRLAPLREGQTPNLDRLEDVIDFRDTQFGGPADYFVTRIEGFLSIDRAGVYAFRLTSDDGSRLVIDGREVILNDGIHGPRGVECEAELGEGLTPFSVEHFENEQGQVLRLEWRPPGAGGFVLVPAEAFRVEAGLTRVVSPGRKVVLDGMEDLRPGLGMPLTGVHPGWVVEDIRPEGFEPQVGAMCVLGDRLMIATFRPENDGVLDAEPNGTIWEMRGVFGGDAGSITVEPIHRGLSDPSGMVAVDGALYVSHLRIHLLKERKSFVRNRVNRYTPVLGTLGAPDETPIDELVNQACDVRRRIQHALYNLAPRMPVRVHPPEDAKHIVMAKLQVVLLTHLLYSPSHVRRRDEEI